MPPRKPKLDPAQPLSDERYERYVQLRAIGVPKEAAADEAGLRTEDSRPWLPGNIARLERDESVIARKAYLTQDEKQIIADTREFIANRLMKAAMFDPLRYGIYEKFQHGEQTHVRMVGIDWGAVRDSDMSVAVASLKFDKDSGHLVDFRRDDALNAVAQLRDMYGLKAPTKIAATTPDGTESAPVIEVRFVKPKKEEAA